VRLVLTAHPEGCLLLYPLPAWEPIRAKVMAFPSLDRQSNLWKRLLVGFAEDVEPTAPGAC
jgi:MraZ protein